MRRVVFLAVSMAVGITSLVCGQETGDGEEVKKDCPKAAVERVFGALPVVVARFDGEAIPASQLKDALHPQFVSMIVDGYQPTEAELNKVCRNTIDRLINDRILLQVCAEAGLQVDLPAAEAKLAELETKIGTERFERGLVHQLTTRERLASQIAEQAMINEWLQKSVLPTITVSDEALQVAYEAKRDELSVPEQVRASHILVAVPADADEEQRMAAKEKAEMVARKLAEGGDFADLARQYSDCDTAKEGGSLGTFARGRVVPEFEQAVFDLEPGAVSPVTKTRFGYHIFCCDERIPAEHPAFAEAQDRVRQLVIRDELAGRVQQIVAAARAKAVIEILVPVQ